MKLTCLGLVILLCFSCKPEVSELPILSYRINSNGEKEVYSIEYSGFKNQLNADFTSKNLSNNIVIANFFFTRCPSICPPMRQELVKLAESFDTSDVMIISHTIDPEYDSPDILKRYANATGISDDTWQFVRSSEANTKSLAQQYMTNFKPNEDGTDFYHSSYAALVDKDRMIRGFYNLLVPEDMERLEADIKILLK